MSKRYKICSDFRIFYALKNPEIGKNPENSHAWLFVNKLLHANI